MTKSCVAKLSLVFILILTSFESFAQSSKTSIAPQFSKMSFSPNFGLMLTDLTIGGAGGTVKTTPELGYSIGVSLYVPSTSSYVDYSTGLYYSQSKTRIETIASTSRFTETTDSTLALRRLSLPIIARVYPFKRSGLFYSRLGAINNILLNVTRETQSQVFQKNSLSGRVYTNNYSEDLTSTAGYRTYSLDALVGMGVQFSVFSRVQTFFELNYLYGVTPLASGTNEIHSESYYGTFGIGF